MKSKKRIMPIHIITWVKPTLGPGTPCGNVKHHINTSTITRGNCVYARSLCFPIQTHTNITRRKTNTPLRWLDGSNCGVIFYLFFSVFMADWKQKKSFTVSRILMSFYFKTFSDNYDSLKIKTLNFHSYYINTISSYTDKNKIQKFLRVDKITLITLWTVADIVQTCWILKFIYISTLFL
jgi:hypothetical protein